MMQVRVVVLLVPVQQEPCVRCTDTAKPVGVSGGAWNLRLTVPSQGTIVILRFYSRRTPKIE